MNTLHLDDCLKRNNFTKKIFKGVFAADKIPHRKVIKPIAFVINTQNSFESGEHWLGVYITPKILELFDSGGRNFNQHYYLNQLRKYHSTKKFVYNNKQIQSLQSDLCGEFVCLFILAKSREISSKKFISYFNFKNLSDNNYLVLSEFKKYFDCNKIVCSNKFKKINNKRVQICINLRKTFLQ
jgi:hypothetical protein